MVGLDAAGKTTILYKLKLGEGKSCAHYSFPFGLVVARIVVYSLFLFVTQRFPLLQS